MAETIYTIPLNETFDAVIGHPECGCPICRLLGKLEETELDLILGASMMEPDVRQTTNAAGFCHAHYGKMAIRKNRLSLALMLESHMDELQSDLQGSLLSRLLQGKSASAQKRLQVLDDRCYLCERIEANFRKMLDNAVFLWDTDSSFRRKLLAQPFFCLPHYAALLDRGQASLSRRRQEEFAADLRQVITPYFDSLRADVKQFIRKFDYRFADEPWGTSKDSVERSIRFLTGE